jgi:hypothetical protein
MKEHCILFKIYTKGLYHGKQFEFCFQDSAGGGDVLEHGSWSPAAAAILAQIPLTREQGGWKCERLHLLWRLRLQMGQV